MYLPLKLISLFNLSINLPFGNPLPQIVQIVKPEIDDLAYSLIGY